MDSVVGSPFLTFHFIEVIVLYLRDFLILTRVICSSETGEDLYFIQRGYLTPRDSIVVIVN